MDFFTRPVEVGYPITYKGSGYIHPRWLALGFLNHQTVSQEYGPKIQQSLGEASESGEFLKGLKVF